MSSPGPREARVGGLQYATTMVLSGTIGVVVVFAEQSSFNVVFFRCLIASGVLFLLCLFTGRFQQDFFRPAPLLATLIAGGALVVNWALLFKSFDFVPIGVATAVYHLKPFILLFYGVLLLRDRLTYVKIAWTALSFLGFLFISRLDAFQEGFAGLPESYFIGIGLAFVAACLQPVSTVVILRYLRPFSPYVIALGQFVLGVFFILPLVSFDAMPESSQQWVFLTILGVVHTVVMYSLMYVSLPKIPTALIAVLQFCTR